RSNPIPVGSSGFLSKASRIDKIYVHDDQIGPFARMESDGVPVCLEKGNPEFSLSTSWRGSSGVIGSARAVPVAILVPLYHKMRITYDVIERIVINFDSSVETFRSNGLIPQLGKRLEWDLFLSTINDLKEEILQSRDLDEAERIEVLTERMPRFVWRATAVIDKKPIVELVFDATDIEQGNFLIRAIRFDRPFFEILKSISNMPSIATIINNSFVSPIFGWIREH
ncbi:MAG: hypothetical protein Q8K68_07065, partial [Nitrospirota bacterium]|nr:hypothetical protein [Nitrospirota bacterium]